MPKTNELKTLFFDIETAPKLAHTWSAMADWIPHGQMVNDTFMLTWAAKWRYGKRILSSRISEPEVKAQDDERIVLLLADLMREADVVIAHNAVGFDIPIVNARLFLHGADPLGPTASIDTLKLSRQAFGKGLAYHKLDYLAEKLGLGNKIKTDFDLWLDAYHGDNTALELMLKYNKHDVVLLEQVFEAMVPYVPRLTRLWDIETFGCQHCGSGDLQKRGFYRTQASTFQKYQCNFCKRYSRARKSEKPTPSVYPL